MSRGRNNLRFFAYLGSVLTVSSVLFVFHAYAVEVSNVKISNVTENSAVVQWQTDVNTDATIHYGLDTNHGLVRDPLFDKNEHELTIEDLLPSTTYYFRVISTDNDGNRASTAGFTFTTGGITDRPELDTVSDTRERAAVERIINDLQEITSEEAITVIMDETKVAAADILRPPSIIGVPRVITEHDRALITWTTDRESSSMVYLVPDDQYDPTSGDPYSISQGDPNSRTTAHEVEVIGLQPATTYHFKVSSSDNNGLTGESEDDTFTTKAEIPIITNIQVSRVQETSAVISWSTGGVFAKGVVEYTNLSTNESQSAGSPLFLTEHDVQLTGLEFGTQYMVTVASVNEAGDEVVSDPFTFVTVRDVISPTISRVNSESTLFPGEDVRIQTIISWETDEPAYCQVFYTQGLAVDEKDAQALDPSTNPIEDHTDVIVGFAPSTVYQFWMRCWDEAENQSRSEDFVLITPTREKSIIDIILENFEDTFGWVQNIIE